MVQGACINVKCLQGGGIFFLQGAGMLYDRVQGSFFLQGAGMLFYRVKKHFVTEFRTVFDRVYRCYSTACWDVILHGSGLLFYRVQGLNLTNKARSPRHSQVCYPSFKLAFVSLVLFLHHTSLQ